MPSTSYLLLVIWVKLFLFALSFKNIRKFATLRFLNMANKHKRPIIVENVEITGMADKGRGIGRDAGGRVIFSEHVAPGDVVDVHETKKKPEYVDGYAIHYHRLSPDRVAPFCEHFTLCGGCRWQHLSYEAQVRHKEQVVVDAIRRIGRVREGEFLPIVPCAESTYYRNKLEYAFSNKTWITKAEMEAGTSNRQNVLGFHRPGAFDKIVDIKHCWLQADPSNDLRLTVKAVADEQGLTFYDLIANEGFMRHIMIRLTTLGELMLIVSFHKNDPKKIKRFLNTVIERTPQLTSLFYCINPKLNDYVGDLITDAPDRRRLGGRQRSVPARFPDGPATAGARHHPHLVVRNDGA